MSKNLRLQNFRLDMEKYSHELNQVDLNHWARSDRLTLSQEWKELRENLNKYTIGCTYERQQVSGSMGQLHLKSPHHLPFSQPIITTVDPIEKVIPSKVETTRIQFSSRVRHKPKAPPQRRVLPKPAVKFAVSLADYNPKASRVLTGPYEADKFLSPKAVVMTDSHHLIIADTRKHRLVLYDLPLKTIRIIRGFLFPDGLSLAGETYVIVTDHHRVSKYDWITEKIQSFVGSRKEGCTQASFSWPKGVATDNDYAYVCDSGNARIVVLTHQMHYESEWAVMKGRDSFPKDHTLLSV
jgi:hypothetical protein